MAGRRCKCNEQPIKDQVDEASPEQEGFGLV